ncbi:general substrate transporter [Dactylonectria estremocensis]|uniref:General substrate transporter n=1 Tax=Dactylonectria estremocensis TaxID=1079267 RepID=A0A9P9J7R6_9HYPO|nr:general substrate transporter [Dactylonectria estremocensis]
MAVEAPVPTRDLALLQRLKLFDGMLVFLMFYMSMCAFNFGFDVGTFGGVQAMQSFGRRFGEYNETLGRYALPAWLSSIMTATPFLGKAVGCVSAGWIAEKWGRRASILALCIVSVVGVTLQTAAQNAAMFTVGRVITFGMTGMAIVVVPIYQAETTPEALRGMFASTIQLMISIGQLVSTCVTYGTKSMDSDAGWMIPIGLQLAMPVVIFLLLPWLPESPRWLLSQDRRAEAEANLRKLRKKASDDQIIVELEAILSQSAWQNEHKGSWAEVFNKENRVRTAVAVLAMFGQQITGQAFASQYGVVFYQSQGFGDKSFLFNVISSCIGLIAIFFVWLYIDGIGRRPILMVGGSFMGLWLFVLGGTGTIKVLNDAEKGLMVASVMLFSFFFSMSWAPAAYVVVSETASLRVKEKTNLFACVVSVLTTFVTSFTIPYLISAQYANLGAKVGFIYGTLNIIMVILVFFFIPELKGRSLEEVDQLFASGALIRKFGSVKTMKVVEMYQANIQKSEVGHDEETPKA